MNDLLLDCKVVLGLAQSMAEREGYDTSVYDNCIEKINEALHIHNVVRQSKQLICDTCKSGLIDYTNLNN